MHIHILVNSLTKQCISDAYLKYVLLNTCVHLSSVYNCRGIRLHAYGFHTRNPKIIAQQKPKIVFASSFVLVKNGRDSEITSFERWQWQWGRRGAWGIFSHPKLLLSRSGRYQTRYQQQRDTTVRPGSVLNAHERCKHSTASDQCLISITGASGSTSSVRCECVYFTWPNLLLPA